ncbi:amino acid ABC transporter substrate-binding protein [Roseomonas alkaliterrae]|uniref:General L-amino acid transport system substrate-binding protein n=1 Tax=Neoroseomonas alkaliterrae TaxID=1452450 RepID=A0A840XQA2_9PROT|nr:amino acid ABC transporter substrate-binding protein [Neoroseomonas alkaliterrae]MBB5690096.1 general L-amino acid transport system substrate-binding protein [Neoroseomonas alkaliterrae]MBR0676202.1 amino acid ABC transporter substrate-binding protein [Neoroseomonas alkaliterrae]
MRTIALAAAALGFALPALAQTASPGPTLAAVRDRGAVICGAHPGAPGFSTLDSQGVTRGLDADTCRAIAAAVLGDANKARFVVLSSQARLPALQSGQVDVLPRTTTWTQTRDTANGLNFTAVTFYDGQGFLIRRSAGVQRARDLAGATICVTSGTTNELNLADWSRSNNIRVQPLVFDQNEETRNAYIAGRCDAFTTDASQLAGIRTALRNPDEHVILPDIISKEPLSPAVRHGDDQWFDIVRWTIFALIEAEELGVTQANVDEMLNSQNPAIRRLLGASGDHGPMMGLDRRWAYNAIKAVGNYGEIFERNLGRGSPIGLQRGVNDLWTRGGLMYAMPIR